jgi:hypothetical protein
MNAAAETTLGESATTEALAFARHYGGMRFNMMAAFFIMLGMLVTAYIYWQEGTQRGPIVLIGLVSSVWFAWFEFLLSYNLIKLWTLVKSRGHAAYSGVYPQRYPAFVWLARVTLLLPYLVAGAAWGSLTSITWLPSWGPTVAAVAVWLLCILGWRLAERGKL